MRLHRALPPSMLAIFVLFWSASSLAGGRPLLVVPSAALLVMLGVGLLRRRRAERTCGR